MTTQPPPKTATSIKADALNGVGWFLPPFVQMGALGEMVQAILASRGVYSQDDLERALGRIYSPAALAGMVLRRYPQTKIIRDYAQTIEEAVEAHVLGLDHIAVGGLVPVIEGAGRQLAAEHGLNVKDSSAKAMFEALIRACRDQAISQQMGIVEEVVGMLDSFATFAATYLYSRSERYPLSDNTNRHGIVHGEFSDRHYGRPLNFFKTIAAVDFLTFASTFKTSGSWMAPDPTPRTLLVAEQWLAQRMVRSARTGQPVPALFLDQFKELNAMHAWLATLPPDETPRGL